MTENIGVRTLNAYERGREFDNYLATHDISMRSLAEINGFTHGYVSRLIDAYQASRKSPEIESLYQDGRLYFNDVPKLVDLYEKSDEPTRELLIETLPELSGKQSEELISVCSSGGSAAGYLKALTESPMTVTAVKSDEPNKKDESANPDPKPEMKKEVIPELDDLWNALQSDEKYVRRQAAIYDCSDSDVREAAKICREGNARPYMLPCMLLMKRNGGKITDKTLETVMRVAEDRNAGKALSLYVSAYEKMKERRSACIKRFESLISDTGADPDVLDRLFGAGQQH